MKLTVEGQEYVAKDGEVRDMEGLLMVRYWKDEAGEYWCADIVDYENGTLNGEGFVRVHENEPNSKLVAI